MGDRWDWRKGSAASIAVLFDPAFPFLLPRVYSYNTRGGFTHPRGAGLNIWITLRMLTTAAYWMSTDVCDSTPRRWLRESVTSLTMMSADGGAALPFLAAPSSTLPNPSTARFLFPNYITNNTFKEFWYIFLFLNGKYKLFLLAK